MTDLKDEAKLPDYSKVDEQGRYEKIRERINTELEGRARAKLAGNDWQSYRRMAQASARRVADVDPDAYSPPEDYFAKREAAYEILVEEWYGQLPELPEGGHLVGVSRYARLSTGNADVGISMGRLTSWSREKLIDKMGTAGDFEDGRNLFVVNDLDGDHMPIAGHYQVLSVADIKDITR